MITICMGKTQSRVIFLLAVVLACCGCALALDPSLEVTQYAHKSWKISEGFGRGDIWALDQTPDGYLWLATEFGLRRFDGVRTVEWQPPAGEHLPSNDIRSLIAARDGTLWIGTAKGLASWKAGTLAHYPEFDKHDVHSLLEDREGTVWAAGTIWAAGPSTPGKLCAISRGGVHCFGSDGRFGPFGVTALYEDSLDNLWLGAANGLWRWKPGSPKHFPVPQLEHYGVAGLVFPRRAFLEDDHGTLLITGPSGIRRFIDGKFSLYPLPYGAPQFKDGKLLRDRDGGLWIGTSDAGLLHIHQGKMDVFAQPDGLSSDVVQNLFEDHEGNIWIATNNGLDRFREYAVPSISVKQGLSTPFVTSVLAARDGSVWIGTFDGLNRWMDGKVTIYRNRTGDSLGTSSVVGGAKSHRKPDRGVHELTVRGLPDNYVGSLYEEPGGRIWISTARGVAYFENGKFTSLSGVHLREWSLSPVARDREGNLWMTSDQGLYRLSGGRVAEYWPSAKLGLRGALSTLLVTDPLRGGLWLGSWQGGVVYFKDGQVRGSYGPADGLPEASVDDLELDSENTLWAATEGGLSHIKSGHVATLTKKNGLPCDRVYSIAQDDAHSFWMYTACGLMRISRSELEAWVADPGRQIQATILDTSDGVKTHAGVLQYAPRITKAADGRVWFVPFDGVSVVDPRRLHVNEVPPPVVIEQITAEGKTYDPVRGLHLPPLIRDLTIDYTALSFVAPESVRFRYKLEGQDSNWREGVTDRRVQYSNLAPGNYRFRVTACNNSGVWNEEGAVLDFSVASAYWQTNWFRAACVAAILAMLWMLYRLRVGALERHQAEVRAFNEQLIKAQEAERMHISGELHDGVLQQITSLTLRLGKVKRQVPPDSEATATVNSLQQQLIQIGTDIRQISHELHPALLQESGLPAALAAYCEEFSKVRGLPVECEIRESLEQLSPVAALCLYRIAQEALGNAAKHSEAKRVEVRLTRSHGRVRLAVSDDGVGCEPNQIGKSKGLGVINMRERVLQLDGKFEFESAPGRGTTVKAEIPFQPAS